MIMMIKSVDFDGDGDGGLMMLDVMVPEGLDDWDDCKWLVVVLFIVIS